MTDNDSDLTQDRFFAEGEGDRYFDRNRAGGDRHDVALEMIAQFDIEPRAVLDLGCSDGRRLSRMRERWECRCVGLDASAKAVAAGAARDAEIELHQGVLAALPFEDASFDVIVIFFVLSWNDRTSLLRAVSEADRVLADGGYLIVADFDPDVPVKNPYHHAPDQAFYTFKQDYARLFEQTNLYRQLARTTFDTAAEHPSPTVRGHDRGSCVLLRKSLHGYYART